MPDHHLNSEFELFETIALINNPEDVKNFFIDLCTPAEIRAFSERWKVCQMLNKKEYSYREIAKITGASITTVTRVARFLNDEKYGGYRKVLDKCHAISQTKAGDCNENKKIVSEKT